MSTASLDSADVSRGPVEVFTVGHSTLPYADFLKLLRLGRIEAVADVRSAPFSRHFPHFNRDNLKLQLARDNLAYVFLGNELGGRPRDSAMFRDGTADYERMAATDEFRQGLNRVLDGSQKFRVAMMCSEHNPLDCHRCLLVGRSLKQQGVTVRHILGSGAIVDQLWIEDKLLAMSKKDHDDFFALPSERLATAYRDRSDKVAYSERTERDFISSVKKAQL